MCWFVFIDVYVVKKDLSVDGATQEFQLNPSYGNRRSSETLKMA